MCMYIAMYWKIKRGVLHFIVDGLEEVPAIFEGDPAYLAMLVYPRCMDTKLLQWMRH